MQLLRESQVEMNPRDRVFCYSRVNAASIAIIALAGILALLYRAANANWKAGYYLAGIVFFFLAVTQRFITARWRPSNWLVRMNDAGLYVKFRSYLNYHLPAEDLTVVLIPFQEIRSARLVREKIKTTDTDGRPATQIRRNIELELAVETDALQKALDHEIGEKPPLGKRWYGSTSTLYEDYPVRMPTPPFLQIRWQATPGPKQFLDALRPNAAIAEPVSIAQDYTNIQSLSRDEQQKRLGELAQRGETITAVYLARKLYGCGIAEAQTMIESFKTGKGAGA